MESILPYLKKFSILIIVVVIVALLALAYAFGYRIQPGGIARVGTVTLTNLPVGTAVYVEQTLRTTTKKPGDVSLELVPGHHSIIVGAPNDYPWSSVVSVSSGTDLRVTPLLLTMKIPVTKLSGDATAAAIKAVQTGTLPTIEAPLVVANGCAHVYVSNNRIVEEAATSTPGCTPPPYLCSNGVCDATIIFAPLAPLKNVFSYPGRTDALAISFAGTLYAIAIDPTTPQFFAPLVRGANAQFGRLPDGTIVVQDGAIVSKLGL